jgi:ankyrin repeat protein
VELLLRDGADNDARSTISRSHIQDAAHGGALRCLKLLLRESADNDAKNRYGQMPLPLAAENGHVECTDVLRRAGPNEVTKNESLCSAAAAESIACVELLLRPGADKDMEDTYNKLAPVHFAAEKGHNMCLKLLLRASAQKSTRDRHGSEPLHLAAE